MPTQCLAHISQRQGNAARYVGVRKGPSVSHSLKIPNDFTRDQPKFSPEALKSQ